LTHLDAAINSIDDRLSLLQNKFDEYTEEKKQRADVEDAAAHEFEESPNVLEVSLDRVDTAINDIGSNLARL
jgi:hypothetical protein